MARERIKDPRSKQEKEAAKKLGLKLGAISYNSKFTKNAHGKYLNTDGKCVFYMVDGPLGPLFYFSDFNPSWFDKKAIDGSKLYYKPEEVIFDDEVEISNSEKYEYIGYCKVFTERKRNYYFRNESGKLFFKGKERAIYIESAYDSLKELTEYNPDFVSVEQEELKKEFEYIGYRSFGKERIKYFKNTLGEFFCRFEGYKVYHELVYSSLEKLIEAHPDFTPVNQEKPKEKQENTQNPKVLADFSDAPTPYQEPKYVQRLRMVRDFMIAHSDIDLYYDVLSFQVISVKRNPLNLTFLEVQKKIKSFENSIKDFKEPFGGVK